MIEVQDDKGRWLEPFYGIATTSTTVPIPSNLEANVGIHILNKWIDLEAFTAIPGLRLISGGGLHLNYGARFRVSVYNPKDKTKKRFIDRILLEYERQENEDFGDEYGLFERPETLSLVFERFPKRSGDKATQIFKLGIADTTHHAWDEEIEDYHEPELSKGNAFFSYGIRW